MNNFFKQVKKTAKDEAIQIAKNVREESFERMNPLHKKSENTPQNGSEMSMMQQVMTENGKIGEIPEKEKQESEAFAKRRLQELEAEIRNLRMKRQQRDSEWTKSQDQILGLSEEEKQAKEQPVEMPSGPQKGARQKGPGKGQKNKMEQGRTKKG